MIEPTSLLKPWSKSTDLVRITCFVRNHVSWNTFWETLISTIIEWPQNFFGKAVSTVLGSLNALDTRYHTRTGQRDIIKTTSHVEPELYKEDMMKILKVVFTIRNTNLSNTNSLFHVLQHNQNCLKVKNRMKIHLLRSTLPSFLPASPVSSVMLTKHFPSDRCSFFIIRRRTLLQGRWAIFVSHTVRISRLYVQHLPLSVRYFLITKKAPI